MTVLWIIVKVLLSLLVVGAAVVVGCVIMEAIDPTPHTSDVHTVHTDHEQDQHRNT